jgi:hypothetical protein
MTTTKETVGQRTYRWFKAKKCAYVHPRSEDRKQVEEQREHKRFQVPKSAFVGLGPYDTKVGQIIDMSMGGLAFRYVGSEEPSDGELDIFLSERDYYVGKIRFKTVSDFEMATQAPSCPVTMRRTGVQFRKLTHHQTSQLEYFIQNYTLGEA